MARMVASIEERNAQTQRVTNAIQNLQDFLGLWGFVGIWGEEPFNEASFGTTTEPPEDAWTSGSSIIETPGCGSSAYEGLEGGEAFS